MDKNQVKTLTAAVITLLSFVGTIISAYHLWKGWGAAFAVCLTLYFHNRITLSKLRGD